MLKKISILDEPSSFKKLCVKEDKIFGCQCNYGCRISCPLWRAREVQWLVNNKGMTIGEAHRATLREYLTQGDVKEALKCLFVHDRPTVCMGELIKILESKDPLRFGENNNVLEQD